MYIKHAGQYTSKNSPQSSAFYTFSIKKLQYIRIERKHPSIKAIFINLHESLGELTVKKSYKMENILWQACFTLNVKADFNFEIEFIARKKTDLQQK